MNANESVWIKINRTRCKPISLAMSTDFQISQWISNFLDNLNESLSRINSNSDKYF